MRGAEQILAGWDGKLLKAVGQIDRESISAFPPGTVFSLKVWEPSTRGARAFITKFIEVCADNCQQNITAEVLKGAIKAEFGWYEGERKEVDGSMVRTYKSIGKMTREELAVFTDQAKQFVQIEMGLDADVMAAEAMDRIKPRRERE